MEDLMEKKSRVEGLTKYLPIVDWLPHYKPEWLRFDIIAALSVWALLVPQSIAYGSIAGVPLQFGLYAALGALLGYALFGTAGQVITGPSAAIAAVSASVVALWATSGSSEWVSYTAALALTAGLVYLLLGWLKMGWVSHFISGAVLAGFVFGFGIGLIADQTPKILGVPKASGSYFQVLVGAIKSLPQTSIPTLIVGVSSIILLLLMRRFLPKWPRTLMVVILGIIISSIFGLADYGVSIVGTIPSGLPSLAWPSFPPVGLTSIILGSLAVLFIGYSESLAAAKEEGSKYGYEIDASQEMVAQGMANSASGLLSGFAVEGSLSKTAVADMAGQKTQLASLFTAGLMLITILFLAGLFTTLPNAVLGAVVIDAGISLVKVKELQHYRLNRVDFLAFMATALAVFFVGVLVGVVMGVVLALLLLIASASRSPVREMAFDKSNNVFVEADRHPDAEITPGIVVVAIHGPLFFADADNFRASVMSLVEADQPYAVVIDLGAVMMMDMDGDKILAKLSGELHKKNIQLLLVRVGRDKLELIRKTGTLEKIGSQNIFETTRLAVSAAQSHSGAVEGAAESGFS
jgi:SulP family sulfate permease